MGKIIAIIVTAVLFGSIYGCSSSDGIADFDRINIAPLNYLSLKHYDLSFYEKLNFEERKAMMTKKENVIAATKISRCDSFIIVDKDYVFVSIKGKCWLFSDNILSRNIVRNIVKKLDAT